MNIRYPPQPLSSLLRTFILLTLRQQPPSILRVTTTQSPFLAPSHKIGTPLPRPPLPPSLHSPPPSSSSSSSSHPPY